jgi:hypothetical protein
MYVYVWMDAKIESSYEGKWNDEVLSLVLKNKLATTDKLRTQAAYRRVKNLKRKIYCRN